jgi:outer membrane protein insertion porin family
MKLDKKFFTTLIFCFFYLTYAFAVDFKKSDIKIFGNKSISKETILNFTDSKKETLNTEELNSFQKKLFETNFFSKIDVRISGNNVSIYLVENPLIEYVLISGLEKRDDLKKEIEKILTLKENNIFSETFLNNDTKSIYGFLSSIGYLRSNVEYTVNKIPNDKVNIFLNIKLNQQFFVKNIFFIGDKKLSTSTLKSTISTSQDSWFSIFSNSAIPSVERVSYDISLLKKLYLSKGYYDVQISNGSIDVIDKKHANVTFVINAGSKYFFEKSLINNNTISLKDNDLLFLASKAKALENKDYNPSEITRLLKAFRDYFINNNITANIDYRVEKLPLNKISIIYDISEVSEKRFVANIIVKGNEITEEKVIRNNLFFSEGDRFNSTNLNKSTDSLKSLGIFKNIKIDVLDSKNSKNVNLVVSVDEKPTGEISAGLGYGTSGAAISFAIKEKNFLGKGIESNISMQLGSEKVLGIISLSDPDFSDTGNSLKGSFFVSQYTYDNAGYDNKVIGSSLSKSYRAFKDVNFETGFLADYDTIDVQSGATNLIKSRDGSYLTTKFFYNVINDKRNRKFQPTSGYTVGFGQGLATLVSEIPYVTNTVFGSFYKEFSEDFIGTIKYKIKSINAFNSKDVKLSDRIFLSDSELRGFAFRGVGPKVSDEYVGGNYSYSTNFSTTVPNGLPDKWGTKSNIFFDVANVWGKDFSEGVDSNKIRSSAGVGFEWVSPLGPLSFTYAAPITKDSTDSIESFNFKLGGIF